MPSKKKLEFNNIIKEFGFPTSIERIRSTYKMECFDTDSRLYWEAEEFEDRLNEEIRKQNEEKNNEYGKDLGKKDYYEEFQKIFLDYPNIFNPEIYLLQMSVLMEKDLLAKEKIRAILKSRGLDNVPDEFVDELLFKDKEASSNLVQLLSQARMNVKEAIRVTQYINEIADANVWLPTSNKRKMNSLINTIKNRLLNSDVILIEVSNADASLNVTNSQIHIGNEKFLKRREREAQKRYDEANREIYLGEKIEKLAPCDLKYIFRYDNLGAILAENMYLPDENVANIDDKTVLKDPVTDRAYVQEDVVSMVKDNLRYVDLDKLLLTILQVEFDKYGENVHQFSYQEARNLKELSEKIENLLSSNSIEIKSDRYYGGISFEKLKASINELNRSYVSGKFYFEEEINDLVEEYLYGQKDVETLTAYEFKEVLKFTDGEILNMLNAKPSILEYLIKNNILEDTTSKDEKSDEKLFKLLEKQDKITAKQLQILYDSDKLSSEYLLQLYMDKDKINLDSIYDLKENTDEQFWSDIVDTTKLVELYLRKDEENAKEQFDKYRKLYKRVMIDDKTLEEKKDIANDILDESIELLKEESLMELYNLGLVTIDTVIDYTGGNSLKKLYFSNELKPIDAKRLFYQGIITEDMLKSIMLDPTVDEGKKISLLYSTFPEVEDTKIMKKLEACLREVTENTKVNSSTHGKSKNKIEPDDNEINDDPTDELKKLKKAYEPRAKFRLLSEIDSEYKFKYNVKDGMAFFYFPNRDEYLIEKLYDKERKPATNVATYILSKDIFEQNQERIIQDGKVNISELYLLKREKNEGVKRLVHTGWANAIIKYYGLDDERKYSKKQILKTKKLAEQVEESKKEIER